MSRFMPVLVLMLCLTTSIARADLKADLTSELPIPEVAIDMMAFAAAADGDYDLSNCISRNYFWPSRHFATLGRLLEADPADDLVQTLIAVLYKPCPDAAPPYPKDLSEYMWDGWLKEAPHFGFDPWLEPQAVAVSLTGAIAYAAARGHNEAIPCLRRLATDTEALRRTSDDAKANRFKVLPFAVLRLIKASCGYLDDHREPPFYWGTQSTDIHSTRWHRSVIAAPRHYGCVQTASLCRSFDTVRSPPAYAAPARILERDSP